MPGLGTPADFRPELAAWDEANGWSPVAAITAEARESAGSILLPSPWTEAKCGCGRHYCPLSVIYWALQARSVPRLPLPRLSVSEGICK